MKNIKICTGQNLHIRAEAKEGYTPGSQTFSQIAKSLTVKIINVNYKFMKLKNNL